MPEIMSAEKFSDFVADECYEPDSHDCPECGWGESGFAISKLSELVKSRDSAIIERCKEKIKESKYGDEWVIRSILDSVLAEIEGE